VEAARDEGAASQRLDVEQHRVVEPIELVPALAARSPLHLLLQLLPPLLHLLTRAATQIGIRRGGIGRATDSRVSIGFSVAGAGAR